jgi:cation/acetate symporter
MTHPAPNDAAHERSSLDGRIAFVTAAFILAFAFVALLDRVGAPERFVAVLAPGIAIAGLSTLGFLLHSMRVSAYYAVGRAAPAAYAGFATAAVVAGLAFPFAAQFAGRSWFTGLCGGVFAGVAAIAFALGPILRKTGAFSLSGLLAARFPGLAPRLAVIVVAGAASICVALAGQRVAVEALVGLTGAGRLFCAFLVGGALLFVAGPGGLSGVLWASAAAAGVALIGLGLPALSLVFQGVTPLQPFSSGSAPAREAAALMERWGDLAPAWGGGANFLTALTTALGVTTLAPLLAPFVATRDERAARRAGVATLAWSFVLLSLMATAIAGGALSFSRAVTAHAPEHLPESLYAASARGQLTVCGKRAADPAQAREACATKGLESGATLRPEDVAGSTPFLLAGAPELAGMGAAVSGLTVAALIALGMALASSGVQAFATALGHETLYRLRGEADLTSRRLAITRLALVSVTAFGAVASAAALFDPRALIDLALGLSAAGVAPVAALAFWSRAADHDALTTALVGLLSTAGFVLWSRGAPTGEVYALAPLVGATAGFGAGALSALSRPIATPENRAFVNAMLRGEGEVLERDKGA